MVRVTVYVSDKESWSVITSPRHANQIVNRESNTNSGVRIKVENW